MDYNGCKKIHTRQVPGTATLKVHCEVRKKLNPWTTHTFYFVPRYDLFSNPQAFALCGDPLIDAFFVETNTLASETERGDSSPQTEPVEQ